MNIHYELMNERRTSSRKHDRDPSCGTASAFCTVNIILLGCDFKLVALSKLFSEGHTSHTKGVTIYLGFLWSSIYLLNQKSTSWRQL